MPALAPNLLPSLPFPEDPKAAAGWEEPFAEPKCRWRPSGELLDASLKARVGMWRGTRLLSPPCYEPLAVKPRANNQDRGAKVGAKPLAQGPGRQSRLLQRDNGSGTPRSRPEEEIGLLSAPGPGVALGELQVRTWRRATKCCFAAATFPASR